MKRALAVTATVALTMATVASAQGSNLIALFPPYTHPPALQDMIRAQSGCEGVVVKPVASLGGQILTFLDGMTTECQSALGPSFQDQVTNAAAYTQCVSSTGVWVFGGGAQCPFAAGGPAAYAIMGFGSEMWCMNQPSVQLREFMNDDMTRFVLIDGLQADVNACIAVLGDKIIPAPGAKGCFDLVPGFGAAPDCPVDFDYPCSPGTWCRGDTIATQCPIEGTCPNLSMTSGAYQLTQGWPDANKLGCESLRTASVPNFQDDSGGFAMFTGTATNIRTCAAANNASLYPAADACFNSDGTGNLGGAAVCPFDWGAACTPGSYCRGETVAAQCPAKGTCLTLIRTSGAYQFSQDWFDGSRAECADVEVVQVPNYQVGSGGFAILTGTQTKIDACAAANNGSLDPAADACFNSDGTGNLGGAAVCPLNWGAACKASDAYCRGDTSASKCPANGRCPAFVPDWSHVMKSVVKREWHWTADPTNDSPWGQYLAGAVAAAKTADATKFSRCQNAPGQASGTFVTSRNGHDTMTIAPTAETTKCDFKWWGDVHNDAVKAFNTDKAEEDQIRTKWSFESFDTSAYEACLPDTGTKLQCKIEKPGCSIKCHDGVANCTDDEDCGGFCEKPPEEDGNDNTVTPQQATGPKCASDAWVAITAPVVAAVLALALF